MQQQQQQQQQQQHVKFKMAEEHLKTETATQLFSRLGVKKSFDGLDAKFFHGMPSGISPGDAIELYGEEGCGKTELLIYLCAKCILPNQWKNLKISGKEAKVVFVDTDYKFPLWRLVNILEHTLRSAYNDAQDNGAKYVVSTEEANEFVRSCMERLSVVRCQSSYNLSKTLMLIESMIRENPDVCLLIIDSISSFYWTDRTICGDNKLEQEFNQREIIRKLKNLQKNYHIVIITTKSAIMNPNYRLTTNSIKDAKTNVLWKHDEYLSQEWNKFITYRYLIQKQNDNTNNYTYFTSIFLNNLSLGECKYLVTDSGIEFL